MQTRILSSLVAVAIAATSMATACSNNETPTEFTNLAQPPPSVEDRSANALIEELMQLMNGESACRESPPAIVVHSESDGPGVPVRIPVDFSLSEVVPVLLLREVEEYRISFSAYKFHWIEEWRIVMFAPPAGNLGGTVTQPSVIELSLYDISDDALSGNRGGKDAQPDLVWSADSVAGYTDCFPRQ